MARFTRAWESADLDALVALLTDDVFIAMPPVPSDTRAGIAGIANVEELLITARRPAVVISSVSHSSLGDRGRDAELGFLRGMQLAGRSDRASCGGRCYSSSSSIMPLGTRGILDDPRKRCARPEARLRA